MKSNTKYTYNKTAANGSVIFKFELENNRWNVDSNFQVYLMLDEPSYTGDPWWNSGNYFWFKADGSFMMQQKADGSRFNNETAKLTNTRPPINP